MRLTLERSCLSTRSEYLLHVTAITSLRDQLNSFNYQPTLIEESLCKSCSYELPLRNALLKYADSYSSGEVTLCSEAKPTSQNQEYIGAFTLSCRNKRFFLSAVEETEGMYLVVRSLRDEQQESKGYLLKEGCLIRIGRKSFYVCSGNQLGKVEQKLLFYEEMKEKRGVMHVESDLKGQCKYCMDGTNRESFLCKPCKCSGSCGLVHFLCLAKWNESKIKKKELNGYSYYQFNKFFCEVCQAAYPKYLQRDGVLHELIPIDYPKGEHLIIEDINTENTTLICLENIPVEGVRLGRGHECEIQIDNPSISRNHASIKKIGKGYYLFDNRSKYGTTVKQANVEYEITKTAIGFQINRTVLMFQLKSSTKV